MLQLVNKSICKCCNYLNAAHWCTAVQVYEVLHYFHGKNACSLFGYYRHLRRIASSPILRSVWYILRAWTICWYESVTEPEILFRGPVKNNSHRLHLILLVLSKHTKRFRHHSPSSLSLRRLCLHNIASLCTWKSRL